MSDDLSPDEQAYFDKMTEYVAGQLHQNVDRNEIVTSMVKDHEWPKDQAEQFVASVQTAILQYEHSPEGRAEMANKYIRHMIFGALWTIGGTVITIATFQAAAGGGTYVVAWGAILFGIFDFCRGFAGWQKYSQPAS